MTIEIKGVIIASEDAWIYEWFGIEHTTPKTVRDKLKEAKGKDVEVEINSGGGDVYAGSEIYTALMGYKGKITVKIVGLAGSAAGVVAMAGRPTLISPTGQFMLHNVGVSGLRGDHRVLEHEADILKSHDIGIANAYRLKTGLAQEQLLEMMAVGGSANTGTWLNAQKALELKFVDEIMFDTEGQLVACAGSAAILPPEAINKLRNLLTQQRLDNQIALERASLDLLKLKYKKEVM